MEREEFIETLERCLRKAFLDVTWAFSTDEDEAAKLCLANDNSLILNYVRTQYQIESIERIKYAIDECRDDYSVTLFMKDGRRLRIGEEKDEAYILLQSDNCDDICLYRDKRRG